MFTFKDELAATLAEIDAAGLTKHERVITTPRAPTSPPPPGIH